jgi:hypothetical protein
MLNAIPNYSRTNDPTIPRAVLEARLKIIDQRRAAIEARLMKGGDTEYAVQELRAEYATLGNARADVDAALRPRPVPKVDEDQRKRDIAFLRMQIKSETELTEHAAEKEERAGNHRAARAHRETIIDIPERVAREYGKDLALLAEV